MDVVAECIHSVTRVAMGSSECVVIDKDDVFRQLNNACIVYNFLRAANE